MLVSKIISLLAVNLVICLNLPLTGLSYHSHNICPVFQNEVLKKKIGPFIEWLEEDDDDDDDESSEQESE